MWTPQSGYRKMAQKQRLDELPSTQYPSLVIITGSTTTTTKHLVSVRRTAMVPEEKRGCLQGGIYCRACVLCAPFCVHLSICTHVSVCVAAFSRLDIEWSWWSDVLVVSFKPPRPHADDHPAGPTLCYSALSVEPCTSCWKLVRVYTKEVSSLLVVLSSLAACLSREKT